MKKVSTFKLLEALIQKKAEDTIRFGNEKHNPHREEQEYCNECGGQMLHGECKECGYQKSSISLENMQRIIKSKKK